MKSKFTVIIFAIFIFLALVGSIEAKEPDKFLASLQKCSKALDLSEEALRLINVSALSIQYRQGSMLEKAKTRGLKYVAFARKRIGYLKKRINVTDTFNLFSILRSLESEMDNIKTQLIDLPFGPPTSQENMPLTFKWSEMVSTADGNLSKAVDDFEDAANSFAEKIDDILQSCK